MPIIVESNAQQRRPLPVRDRVRQPRRRQPRGAQADPGRTPRTSTPSCSGPRSTSRPRPPLADTLRVTRPAISVILIRRRVDTSVLAEALRSGMREVVEERDLTGLGAAVGRARQVWQALNGAPRTARTTPAAQLITVFSPKGGVGKTTLAVNLAVALTDKAAPRRSASSTSTWRSATSRSPCSCSRPARSPTPYTWRAAWTSRPRAAAHPVPRGALGAGRPGPARRQGRHPGRRWSVASSSC